MPFVLPTPVCPPAAKNTIGVYAGPGHAGPRRAEHAPEGELCHEDQRQKEQRQDDEDRAGSIEIRRQQTGEPSAEIAPGPETARPRVGHAHRQAQEGRRASDCQGPAHNLCIDRVDLAAPETVPSQGHQPDRQNERGESHHLKRQLGQERSDTPGEVHRRHRSTSVEEPHRVGGVIGRQGNQPEQRGGEQHHAEKLTRPS